LFLLVGWLLWKERNARTFDASSVEQLDVQIKEEAYAWCLAGFR
jgi:hypothetical protein